MATPQEWLSESAKQLDPFLPFRSASDFENQLKKLSDQIKPPTIDLPDSVLKTEHEKRHWQLLKSGKALAVITGQQPGLMTGPAYTLYKVWSAISVAKCIADRLQRPCFAIFWCASEDHDLHEILTARKVDQEGKIHRLRLKEVFEKRAAEVLPWSDDLEKILQRECPEWLIPEKGERYVDHFKNMLRSCFSEHGLLILEPRDLKEGLKSELPLLHHRAETIIQQITDSENQLRKKGIAPQAPRRTPLPLFAMKENGARVPLHYKEGVWYRDMIDKSYPDLNAVISEEERLSPGALIRPILAQKMIPCIASVLGPGEWMYHQQILEVFESLETVSPLLWPRLNATVLDAQRIPYWYQFKDQLGLKLDGSWSKEYQAEPEFKAIQDQIEKWRENLRDTSDPLDHHLIRFERQLKSAMNRLQRSRQKEQWRRLGGSARSLHDFNQWIRPVGRPQERFQCGAMLLQKKEDLQCFKKAFENPLDFHHRLIELE